MTPPPPIRLVVVDDHPVVRDGLTGMFADESGIVVVGEAADGPEALRVIEGSGPDVVLMDLRMPAGDGVPAIRAPAPVPASWCSPRSTPTGRYAAPSTRAPTATSSRTRDAPTWSGPVHDLAAGRSVLVPSALATLTARAAESSLTTREADALRLVARGLTNAAIARRLLISESTVKTHLLHAYAKLGVTDRASAVRVAWERDLV